MEYRFPPPPWRGFSPRWKLQWSDHYLTWRRSQSGYINTSYHQQSHEVCLGGPPMKECQEWVTTQAKKQMIEILKSSLTSSSIVSESAAIWPMNPHIGKSSTAYSDRYDMHDGGSSSGLNGGMKERYYAVYHLKPIMIGYSMIHQCELIRVEFHGT